MRSTLLIIAIAGLACGSQETSTSPDPGAADAETPAVSAVPAPAAQAPAAPVPAAEPPSEATNPDAAADTAAADEVTTCLGLVQEGKLAEALVACQAAAQRYPDNAAVADALAKATAAKLAAETEAAAKGVGTP
jgi:hypothetical protein